MLTSLSEKSEYIGDGLWRWSVFLSPDARLQDIEQVVYTLHPSFNRPVRRVRTPEDRFLVEDTTSCPFTVYARVIFSNGSEQLLEKALELTPRPSSSEPAISEHRKPGIISIDDDIDVLRGVVGDLRSHYGASYQISGFESGFAALDYLQSSRGKDVEVALLIADVRMPGMDGMDFLVQVNRVCPRAKRVLLTAFADSDAAIRAINAGVNGFILKPWDPPERVLYPAIDDLLQQWWSTKNDLSVSESLRTRIL